MMEIRDHDEPVRYFEPRNSVVFDYLRGSELRAGQLHNPGHGQETQVGQNHLVTLTFGEKNRIGCEVMEWIREICKSGFNTKPGTHDRNDWSIWGRSFALRH